MTTATATKATTFKSTVLGTVILSTYVDPCPGKIGTDKVPSTCGRCGGSGVFECFRHIYAGRCFQCGGSGSVPTNVSTVRKHAKSDAFYAEFAAELAAVRLVAETAANIAIAAAKFAADWEAAHTEDARRSSMVQGFLGQVGDKVTGTGTVAVAKYISGSYNRSSSVFLVVELDSGQVIKTFGSGESLFALDRGDRVVLSGAVKAHESYRGQDQTVLTRAKAILVVDEAA